jgi:hypothetical protein
MTGSANPTAERVQLDEMPTATLASASDTLVSDVAALLDHRIRSRAIPVGLAPAGRYLEIQGADTALLIALEREVTHIGRGLAADIRLDDDRVSRRHAIVVRRGGHVRVLDDRSTAGTFVNGRRVVEAELLADDVIVLGPVVLRYVEVAGG